MFHHVSGFLLASGFSPVSSGPSCACRPCSSWVVGSCIWRTIAACESPVRGGGGPGGGPRGEACEHSLGFHTILGEGRLVKEGTSAVSWEGLRPLDA